MSMQAPDIEGHPHLDSAQLGHVRHVVRLANQLPGDWSYMGHYEPDEEGDDAFRYQLAMMAYALGAAQAHHTPAYRELYRDTTEKLIEKMLRFDVWGYWENTSRGSKILDPGLEALGEGWLDPVVRQNIMYSGHLLKMVGLYEMLYRTGRYDRPGSLTFEFRPVFRGMGPERFEYDHGRLLETILQEFQRNDYLGCECEPNTVFVLCNQVPLLGFKHYDHTHGTQFAPDTMKRFEEAWRNRSTLFDTDASAEELPMYWMVRQQLVTTGGVSGIKWCTLMHPWHRDYARHIYPQMRDAVLRRLPDGTLGVDDSQYFEKRGKANSDVVDFVTDPMMLGVHTFGFTALAASEMGDRETLDGMMAYAERYLAPTWEDGCLYYPRNDEGGSEHYLTCLSGNALIAWARLNVPDGIWTLYNRPWTQQVLDEPQPVEIDHPRVLVQQAFYDRAAKRLAIGLLPGGSRVAPASFAISGLDPRGTYEVTVNGRPIDAETGRLEWRGDRLHLATELRASTAILVTDTSDHE